MEKRDYLRGRPRNRGDKESKKNTFSAFIGLIIARNRILNKLVILQAAGNQRKDAKPLRRKDNYFSLCALASWR